MAPPRGSAAYKKQDGTLALSKDNQTISWTPAVPASSKLAVTFHVSNITSKSLPYLGDARDANIILRLAADPRKQR